MKTGLLILLVGLCRLPERNIAHRPPPPSPRCIPTDLIVKTKKQFRIDQVFDLINTYNHSVEYIYGSFYSSALPPDSLQYVLDYLNRKSYTNDGKTWFVSGYRDYQTQAITIFPRLYRMNDRANQADWLASMKELKLTEVTDREDVGGSIIFFTYRKLKKRSGSSGLRCLTLSNGLNGIAT